MNPGDLVFQPLSLDIKSGLIAFHELTLFRIPKYCHCGIYAGEGKMYTASGIVELQDAGAYGNIAVPHAWKNWAAAEALLKSQLGKPYDWLGWAICAVYPLIRWIYDPPIDVGAFTCSSLVSFALVHDDERFSFLNRRTVTPDDVYQGVAHAQ